MYRPLSGLELCHARTMEIMAVKLLRDWLPEKTLI